MHYRDHVMSVVRPSLLTFRIFDFSSEIAGWNSKILDRKQDHKVLYQVCDQPEKQDGRPGLRLCFVQLIGKNKMAAQASD